MAIPQEKIDAFRLLYEKRILPDDVLQVLDDYDQRGELEKYIDQFADAFSERLQNEQQTRMPTDRIEDVRKATDEFKDEIESLEVETPLSTQAPSPEQGTAVIEQEQKITDSLKDKVSDLKSDMPESAYDVIQRRISEGDYQKAPQTTFDAVKGAAIQTAEQYGRQVGLTARYLAEGIIGGVIDPFYQLTAFATNLAMPKGFKAPPSLIPEISSMLDKAGFPNPEGTAEKIIGTAAKMVAASGAGIGAARGVAGALGPAVKGGARVTPGVAAAEAMAAEPGLQSRAALGAGVAQGVAEQAGVGPVGQMAASIAGGGVTGMLSGKKRDLSALREAQERGINVSTTDILKPPFQRAYDFINDLVLLGPRVVHKGPQAKRKAEAIARTFEQFGGDKIMNASEKVALDLINRKYKRLSHYADIQDRVIKTMTKDGSNVPMPNTIDELSKAIKSLEKTNAKAYAPAIDIFKNFKEVFKSRDFRDVIKNKRLIGDMLDDPNLASISDEPKKFAKEIYKAIKFDTDNFVLNKGNAQQLRVWKRANEAIADMIQDLKNRSLKKIFEAGKYTRINREGGKFDIELKVDDEDLQSANEAVISMLESNKKSQNIALYKNLTPKGRSTARAAIIQDIIKKSGGIENVDPKKFRKAVADRANTIGIHFRDKDYDSIMGLVEALKLTAKSDPGVGVRFGRNLPYFVTGGISPIVGGIWNAIGTSLAIGQFHNIFESKYIRNLLIKIPKMKIGREKDIAVKNVIRAIQGEILNQKSMAENESVGETGYIKSKKVVNQ